MDPDSVDLKAPLFSFFVGFGTKGTPADSDAGRSPTSPLDFGGLFSPSHRNKWFSHKLGLSVLSSSEAHCDSFSRDNVVLAPQIKVNVQHTTAKLSTQVFDHPEHTSPRRSSSSPMDIISSQAYSRSLSGREMALSEDYTCIISLMGQTQKQLIYSAIAFLIVTPRKKLRNRKVILSQEEIARRVTFTGKRKVRTQVWKIHWRYHLDQVITRISFPRQCLLNPVHNELVLSWVFGLLRCDFSVL